MCNRPGHFNPAQRADVGKIVQAMRESGVLWKQIEYELRHSRAQLMRYRRDHLAMNKSDHTMNSTALANADHILGECGYAAKPQ